MFHVSVCFAQILRLDSLRMKLLQSLRRLEGESREDPLKKPQNERVRGKAGGRDAYIMCGFENRPSKDPGFPSWRADPSLINETD